MSGIGSGSLDAQKNTLGSAVSRFKTVLSCDDLVLLRFHLVPRALCTHLDVLHVMDTRHINSLTTYYETE